MRSLNRKEVALIIGIGLMLFFALLAVALLVMFLPATAYLLLTAMGAEHEPAAIVGALCFVVSFLLIFTGERTPHIEWLAVKGYRVIAALAKRLNVSLPMGSQ